MKDEAEVREALRLLIAYKKRRRTISSATVNNLLGVEAAFQWLLGEEKLGDPVASTIRDLKKGGL